MEDLISVIGATEHIGNVITETLLKRGIKVRAIARNKEKLEKLKSEGAEIFRGDLENTSSTNESLKGSKTIFAMIPPYYHLKNFKEVQKGIGDNILNAIKTNSIRHVVLLSSIGAELDSGTGQILVLHDFEEKLKKLPQLSVMALRCTYFMENHLASIPLIIKAGIMGSVINPDFPFGMIATKDIAASASAFLMNPDFTGFNVQYLLGPRDYKLTEAASILGNAIGKPDLAYVKFPREDFITGIVQAGFSGDSAEALYEGFTAISEGRLSNHLKRNHANTTPTTLEEFAETVFAPVYRMSEVEVTG